MITNVSIRVKNQGLLDFFYPDYKRLHEFSMFAEGGVIYDGDSKYLQKFRDNGVNYIYIVGTPEYDLTVAENLIRFVYSKWGKEPTKKVLEYISELDYNRESDAVLIEDIAKTVWVAGRTFFDLENDVYLKDFLYAFPKASLLNSITKYLKAAENSSYYINATGGIIRFLHNLGRKDIIDDPKINPMYRSSLKNFMDSRSRNVRNALYKFLYSEVESEELKIVMLISDIIKSKSN